VVSYKIGMTWRVSWREGRGEEGREEEGRGGERRGKERGEGRGEEGRKQNALWLKNCFL
jgi:hypothetical protein